MPLAGVRLLAGWAFSRLGLKRIKLMA